MTEEHQIRHASGAELAVVPLSVYQAALARAKAEKDAIHTKWEHAHQKALRELTDRFHEITAAQQALSEAAHRLETALNNLAAFAEGAGAGERLSAYCAQKNGGVLDVPQTIQVLAGALHARMFEFTGALRLNTTEAVMYRESYAPLITIADEFALAAGQAARGDCAPLMETIGRHSSEQRRAFFDRLREAVSEGGRPPKDGRAYLAELIALHRGAGKTWAGIARLIAHELEGKTDDLSREALHLLTYDQYGAERPYALQGRYLKGVWRQKKPCQNRF